MSISCYCSFWFPSVKGKGDETWLISDIKRDLLCQSRNAQYPWATAAGWFVSLRDLQQTCCCCPFQDTFSHVVDEQSVLIPPWIWPLSKKRNYKYNESHILISHVLAFRVAQRMSPHCSCIILKWMSGKGWHVVNLGRSFSFHRYIIVMSGCCSNLYFFQATKLHSGARQDLLSCNSEVF